MIASPTEWSRRELQLADGDWRWAIGLALVASIALLFVIAVFLFVRRVCGALDTPLAPTQLVVAATLLLAWALAVRALVPGQFAIWLTSIVLLSFAVGCSFPGDRAVDWIVWLTAFGALVASHNVVANSPARRRAPAIEPELVLQQLTRSRTSDGHDVLHGILVAEFAPGERAATLYVAFCPPFERLPHVELESAVEANVVQTLHRGAQIDVRLSRPAESPTTATVELFAIDAIDR